MKTKKRKCVLKGKFNIKVTGYQEAMNLAMTFRYFFREYGVKKSEYKIEVKNAK
jgi:hypothetical protein